MKAAEHRESTILGWSEKVFQQQVIELAKTYHWRVYHTYDSRRSEPGFPDLTLLHCEWGLLFRELKTEKGRVRTAQGHWLHGLIDADQDAAIWRPRDWISGAIQDELRGVVRRTQ